MIIKKKLNKTFIILFVFILLAVLIYILKNSFLTNLNDKNNIINNIDYNSNNQYKIEENKENNMNNVLKINVTIGNEKFTATIEENNTSKGFLKLLPLKLNMNDLNNNEKYFYLSSNLTIDPKPIMQINKGDIMLFGDNCLVLFYETFNTTYSYTKIATIDNPEGLNKMLVNSNINILFEIDT